MKRIGFIGAYDKIDMIMYVAKILETCGKKVLVVDSTINQKARYIIPAINAIRNQVSRKISKKTIKLFCFGIFI